jgi:hypothetical protein
VPLGREIGLDCVSNKDGGAKQTQNYRDNFNHYDAPLVLLHLIADPTSCRLLLGQKMVSFG